MIDTFVSIVVTIFAAVFGWLFILNGKIREIDGTFKEFKEHVNNRLDQLEKQSSKLEDLLIRLARIEYAVNRFIEYTVNRFEEKNKGNPISIEKIKRRRELTEKLKRREISSDEAKELCEILDEELEEAKRLNDTASIVAILLLRGIAESFIK